MTAGVCFVREVAGYETLMGSAGARFSVFSSKKASGLFVPVSAAPLADVAAEEAKV